jgi:hypothetical protein
MNLRSIPGIGKASFELLEAAGFADAEALSKAGVDELAKELERANSILQIAKRAPARGNLVKWITAARELTGTADSSVTEVKMPVNYELSPQVMTMLANAPFAIPLPARILMENQLAVGDIPAAIMLNRYSGDLEVRVEDRIPAPKAGRPVAAPSHIRMSDTKGPRLEIDNSRIKTIGPVGSEPAVETIQPLTNDDDRVSLIRGPRLETNKGRRPESRLYIRGVLHSHPVSLGVGAFVTLLMLVVLPAGVISAGLLLLSREKPAMFGWVPGWLLVFPLSLPVFGIIYLIWGLHGSCRICGQKLFVPRMCLKNPKAHHIRGMGHIIPLAMHILLFKWFRCSYCGTPVRLKK